MAVLIAVAAGIGGYVFGSHRKTSTDQAEAGSGCSETTNEMVKYVKEANELRVNPLSLQEAIMQATDLCQRVKDECGTPGLVVAVSVDGRLVWTQGFGYADVENRLPCTPNTVMRIASISKSITMTAVAKAVENGELDIDLPVQTYVKDFPKKTINGKEVEVTTRQLVSHLSGVRHYSKDYVDMNQAKVSEQPQTVTQPLGKNGDPKESSTEKKSCAGLKVSKEFENQEYYIKEAVENTTEALALFKDDPLVHEPGTKYLYSTHAWTLIAAILEGATKHNFPDLMRRLFLELGLENTYLDENQPLIYNRSRYYVRTDKNALVNAPYVDCSYKLAGGGMLSTAPDLVRFGNAMLYSYQWPGSLTDIRRNNNNNNQPQQQLAATTTTTTTRTRNDNNSKLGSGSNESAKQYKIVASAESTPGYLKPSTVRQLWSPVELTNLGWNKDDRYGMGWFVVPKRPAAGFACPQRFYVSHTGAAVGASSVLMILPSSNSEGSEKGDTFAAALPRGVSVAIIVNMIDVGLSKTALSIAKLFEGLSLSFLW